MAEEGLAEVSRRWDSVDWMLAASMALSGFVLLWHVAKLVVGGPEPEETVPNPVVRTIDGCEYVVRWTGPSGWVYEGLTHKGDCRNPIHWTHVLSDTSWYGSVRRDSNPEIHIQKGASDGEEGKAVR